MLNKNEAKMFRIDTPDGMSNFVFGVPKSIETYRKSNPDHKVFGLKDNTESEDPIFVLIT